MDCSSVPLQSTIVCSGGAGVDGGTGIGVETGTGIGVGTGVETGTSTSFAVSGLNSPRDHLPSTRRPSGWVSMP